MKRIVIELDDEKHWEIKAKAFNQRKTIKEYVLELIEKDMQSAEKEGE